MRLHQINQLAYSTKLETTWQNSLKAEDQVLLIEEGILRIHQNTTELQALSQAKQVKLYYLQSDATAYGLAPTIGIALSDEEWVEMAFSATANITW
jgi:tRNA 2-thiouridine synthesizing protein B